MTLHEPWARLLAMLRRRELDRDLEDEIAIHLELASADNLQRGMGPDEARRQAAVRFGSVASAKEGVWDQRGLPVVGGILQDARFALRGMRQSPGFTLLTVLTLALGIGFCSLVFTVLNVSFLRQIPDVANPGRLATMQAPVTYPDFEKCRDHSGVTIAAAAFIGPVPITVAAENTGADKERIFGHLVSPEYFSTLGVEPLLGRFFDPEKERPGAAPAVVVSERFWRSHLHADRRALGSTLRVNGRRATLVGVGPKDFAGVFPMPHAADVFVPVTADPAVAPELDPEADGDVLHRTTQPVFRVLLRLPQGITMAAAEARLDAQTRRGKKDPRVHLMAAGGMAPVPRDAHYMIVMFYALLVTLILSLTCANLAGLILARGSARGKEIAIRLSIGAGRFRLIRQLLTESWILAGVGGAAGFGCTSVLLDVMAHWRDASVPAASLLHWGADLRLALFTLGISALAATGFGLIPALAITRPDLSSALKTNTPMGFGQHRRFGVRNLFVVYQVAAAMMLVLIMGFAIAGFRRSAHRDPQFDPAPLSLFSLDPPRDGYSPRQSAALLEGFGERLQRIPGVHSVSLADQDPLSDQLPNTPVSTPSPDGSSQARLVALKTVGPRFFDTLGAPMLRGAEFEDRDLRSDPVAGAILPAVINQTAAKELFGDADPLGRRIQQAQRTFVVTGVVRYDPPVILINLPVATVFQPLTMQDLRRGPAQGTTILIRSRTRLDAAALRRELAAIDGSLSMINFQPMPEHLADLDRLGHVVTGFYLPMGVFGLILACLGLAGVTAQSVQRRRKEIGIRMALGARRPQMLRLVMQEAAVMVSVGAAIGFAGAYGVSRLLAAAYAPMAQIIGWSAGNPVLTLGVPFVLVTVAGIACYVPARMSAAVDPMLALREE